MFILFISFILIWLFHFYSGFRGPFKVAKGGIIVPGVPSVQRGYWGRVCDSLCYDVLALCKINFRTLCFVNKILKIITPYSLFISHTKMPIVFRSGRSTNYIARKPAIKTSKSSFSRVSHVWVQTTKHWQKPVTSNSKIIYDAEMN